MWVDIYGITNINCVASSIYGIININCVPFSIYGGRIDNEFDQRLMNAFINKLFTIKTFDGDFKLISDDGSGAALTMPDGIRREQFLQWVNNLSDNQLPCWLGLPNNAEKVLLTTQGTDLIGKMLKMQLLEDDDVLPEETTEKARRSSSVDGRPAWMRTLFTSASTWLKLVPKSLTPLKRTVDNIKVCWLDGWSVTWL